MAEKDINFSLYARSLNSIIAAVTGYASVYPLDLVKTRLQNQQLGTLTENKYSSIANALSKTYKYEGIRGMYRGLTVTLLLVTPGKILRLVGNDFFRYHLRSPDHTLSVPRQFLSGALAGGIQVFLSTPRDVLKIQLQDAGRIDAAALKSGQTSVNAISVTRNLLQTRGIAGLYRGLKITFIRDISFSTIFFPTFTKLDSFGPRKKDGSGQAVFWCSFLSGLVAATCAAFLVTPIDLVKTRLQLIKRGEGELKYAGIVDAFVKIYKIEGSCSFFQTAVCRIITIAPMQAIAQMVYYIGIAEGLLGYKRGLQD